MEDFIHSHPVIVEIPKMDPSLKQNLEQLTINLGRYADVMTSLIHFKQMDNSETPMDLYKKLFYFYCQNDLDKVEELDALLRMYNYDFRKVVLMYENSKVS